MCTGRFLNRGDLILVFCIVLTAFSLLEFHRLREQDLNSILSCVNYRVVKSQSITAIPHPLKKMDLHRCHWRYNLPCRHADDI